MFDPDCIFCKIIKKELPADVVYEDDKAIAFKDLYPKAPVHVLVIPKKHVEGVVHMQSNDEYLQAVWNAINKVVEKLGIKESGFRIVVNYGKHGKQEVMHLHFHILGGKQLL